MTNHHAEPLGNSAPTVTDDHIAAISGLFPGVLVEGKVDFDRLREALGDAIDERKERYTFTWAGRADAVRALKAPAQSTLIPARDESTNFDDTQNVFIEGDNLEVLKLLYKPYFGRVKMIYIDPPYNTGNDFVYPDNFTEPLDNYLKLTGQKDANGNHLTSNPESNGRYHSAWLSMMYPRLFLARQLLREDGVIFVSIDDHEVHHLRMLMNEVFGEENFVTTVAWQKRVSPANDAQWFSSDHDSIMIFARAKEAWRPYRLARNEDQTAYYKNPDGDPRGPWNSATYTCNKSKAERPNLYYPIPNPTTGEDVFPKETAVWKYGADTTARYAADGRIYWGADGTARYPRIKLFLSEMDNVVPRSVWGYGDAGHTQEAATDIKNLFGDSPFDTPKPVRLIKRMLDISTSKEPDIILDFFAGSGTTGQSVLELNHVDGGNRRFILVQLAEKTENPQYPTIADIGKERIRRVIDKMTKEQTPKLALDRDEPEDRGFRVFKQSPSHIKPWNPPDEQTGEDYAAQVAMFEDRLTDGWKPEDVLYEVALREGFTLSSHVEIALQTKDVTLYKVSDTEREQQFYISLDEKLSLADVEPLNLTVDQTFICRDVALDDTIAANLALRCRLRSI